MILILVVLASVLLFYRYLYRPQIYWREKNVKQSTPVPLLGDNWKFFLKQESVNDIMIRLYNKFPDSRYLGFYQTMLPSLLIRDPELIKQIAIKDFDYFTDHRNFISETDPIWTRHLFGLKGDEWRAMRATLSPTFTSRKMKSMFTLMNESAQQFMKYYMKKRANIIEIEAKDSFTRFANDVIATCAFGITCDSLEHPNNEFYIHGKEITDLTGMWKGLKFIITFISPRLARIFNLKIFPDYCGAYFKNVVREAIKYREAHKIVRPDMINLLMQSRSGKLTYEEELEPNSEFAAVQESSIGRSLKSKVQLSDMDIAAQVLIFFFAGFDTISTNMSFLAYELAKNQEVQKTLRDEIDESVKATNGNLTYEVLFKLKYLDMVISEGLRKYLPVIGADRVCVKPYVIEPKNPDESPVQINVGDVVWFPSIALHFDPNYFPNPDRFDPERFSDENKHKIKPYTYIPFGVGPRNCIGSRFALMEIKILFYHLLSNFEIVVIDKTPLQMKIMRGNVVPKLEGGYWVGFKKRRLENNVY